MLSPTLQRLHPRTVVNPMHVLHLRCHLLAQIRPVQPADEDSGRAGRSGDGRWLRRMRRLAAMRRLGRGVLKASTSAPEPRRCRRLGVSCSWPRLAAEGGAGRSGNRVRRHLKQTEVEFSVEKPGTWRCFGGMVFWAAFKPPTAPTQHLNLPLMYTEDTAPPWPTLGPIDSVR